MCGVIGLPPSGCVLQQSKCLAIIKREIIRDTMVGGIQIDNSSLIASEELKEAKSEICLEDEGEDADNLMTALLLGTCVSIVSLLKLIPTSVLWGYFVYMAIDSLPGYEFWERFILLFVPPGRRHRLIGSFAGSVPHYTIVRFTVFQIVYFLTCFGMTWIPIPGIYFPLPFFIITAVRQYILPKLFHPYHLIKLDEAEDEEFLAG